MRNLLERSVGPGVELQFEIAQDAPLALADSNQVELALLNLVINARDAMSDGGRITIAVDRAKANNGDDLKPGQYVRLSVVDTGVGMDAETLKRAIEPFFSTKEVGKGTGLGLSMIHGLAVQLDGALKLVSAPDKGTRAELHFPVTTALAQVMEFTHLEREDGQAVARAKILIIDDDVLIAMGTVDMLEDLGHEVIEANSSASALELLKAGSDVDLMITDFSMPGINGAQLAEEAKRLKPGMPILLATGFAEMPKGAITDIPRLGKPYSQAQLAREINRLLPNAPDPQA
ncbi:MAG: response regulator [Hyphomonadaceae bacterium]|nr:response regulator [Hyphomonadaceae bacterium]